MRDDDGRVVIDEDKCCGNKACVTACPYGAIFINDDTKKAAKAPKAPKVRKVNEVLLVHQEKKALPEECLLNKKLFSKIYLKFLQIRISLQQKSK